jgi:hypothetical protein
VVSRSQSCSGFEVRYAGLTHANRTTTAETAKDDGASENNASREYIEKLQARGVELEIQNDGWVVVETVNAKVQNTVATTHRSQSTMYKGSIMTWGSAGCEMPTVDIISPTTVMRCGSPIAPELKEQR